LYALFLSAVMAQHGSPIIARYLEVDRGCYVVDMLAITGRT